jgi:hypothetical protein
MSDRVRDESGRFAPTIAVSEGSTTPIAETGDPALEDYPTGAMVHGGAQGGDVDGWDHVIIMVDTATMAEYWRGPIEDFRETNGADSAQRGHVSDCLDRLEANGEDFAEVAGTFHLRRACHFDAERNDRGEIVAIGALVNAGIGE